MRDKICEWASVSAIRREVFFFWMISPVLLLVLTAADPVNAQSLAELSSQGQTALQNQQFDRAEKIYERVVQIQPRSAEAHSNLGLSLYMLRNYLHAITELKKALELDPQLDHAQVLLALSYFDSGDLDHAVPLLEKAYQSRKDDPVVAAHLGLAYLRQQKDDQALVALSRWVGLEPNSPDALYFKGKASLNVASDSFVQLGKVAPDSFRVVQLRAEMLRQQKGMAPEAINEYKKAIALKPDAVGLHYELGTLYREGGRLDEALAEFNEELKLSPNDAMTCYLLGDIYLQQNQLDRAQQHLSQALTLQPAMTEAQLDLAKTYQAQGKADDAVKLLKEVVTADPGRQDAHYLLFRLYKDRGQMDEAKKELQIFETLKRKAEEEEQKRMQAGAVD